MAIDSSIYSQIQQPRPVNLLAQYADMMQVQGAQQANQLNRLKMDEYTRGVERQNKLTGMLQTGADAAALRQGGFLKEANEWDEQAAKIEKERAQGKKYGADAEKAQLETAMSKVRFGAQLLSTAKDQATYDAARQEAIANGLDVSRMPAQFDPAFVQRKFQESQTVAEQLDQVWKQKGYDLDVQKVAETGRHNRASEGIQVRGQNLTDARAREANANAGWTYDAERGVRINTRSGAVAPVNLPAGAAMPGKPLNEGQGKANLFGTRMQESHRILTELESSGVLRPGNIKTVAEGVAGAVPFIGDSLATAAGAATNWTQSAGQQKVEQARRDFINAVLRRESGAVISPEEFVNAEKQYFPQAGDSAEVIAQKRRNREMAIAGIQAEVPGGFRTGAPAQAPAAAPAAPNIDSLLDKYK